MKFQLSTDMSITEAVTYFPFLMDSMTRSSSYPRKFETPDLFLSKYFSSIMWEP